MNLSKQEEAKLRSWLEGRGKWTKCPHCGHGDFEKQPWLIRERHDLTPSLSAVIIECPDCSAICLISYERAKL